MDLKRIIVVDKEKNYLKIWKIAKEGGGKIASNILLDKILMSNKWKGITEKYGHFTTFAREFVAYTKKNEVFYKGKDLVCSFEGEDLKKIILPASYIHEDALNRRGVCLVIDPSEIIEEKDRYVIFPSSSVFLNNFFGNPGYNKGKVDTNTRIPVRWGIAKTLLSDRPLEFREIRFFL